MTTQHSHVQALAAQREPQVNLSIRNNFRAIEKFIGSAIPRWRSAVLHVPGIRQALDEYRTLAASSSENNVFYGYIRDHIEEGFSPAEWETIAATIKTRGAPTFADLAWHETKMLRADVFTPFIRKNLGTEIGIGSKETDQSHADLMHDMLHQIRYVSPEIDPIDNAGKQAMMEQIIRFRKAGLFKLPADKNEALSDAQIEALYDQFEELCSKNGLVLPHHLREAAERMAFESTAAADRFFAPVPGLMFPDKKVAIEGTEMPEQQMPMPAKQVHLLVFKTALKNAQKLPDSFLDYGDGTRKNQGMPHWDNPYEASHSLTGLLDLLSREADSAGNTQVRAMLELSRAYVGYIDQAPLTQAEKKKAKEEFIKWGKDHVDESVGAEEDHANDARQLFMIYLTACARPGMDIAGMLEQTLRFNTNEGYLRLQTNLMQAAVDTMQAERAEAKEAAQATGQNAFIPPKPEQATGFLAALMRRTSKSAEAAR